MKALLSIYLALLATGYTSAAQTNYQYTGNTLDTVIDDPMLLTAVTHLTASVTFDNIYTDTTLIDNNGIVSATISDGVTTFSLLNATFFSKFVFDNSGNITQWQLTGTHLDRRIETVNFYLGMQWDDTLVPLPDYASKGNMGNPGIWSLVSVSTVPESETYCLMILGFGLVGTAYRRRLTHI
ncbi:PEP-CTERM sorting domain-containing protein [Methylophilus sp. OH31]|uniref:PEP-CTERM sorting domain-containing protein n=1 Tax=Methylophilus sp. OH31 TaxID=1387312 RepID=UPI000466CABE|nr:PEP-CTERM sorting domain-containing protein [Methylophilus sp. OH31]